MDCVLEYVLQDTVIYERLSESSRYRDITLKHLEQFATEGLYKAVWISILMETYHF